MSHRTRTLISAAVLAAVAVLCALIHAGTARERSLRTCEGVRVEYADAYRFVSEQDIKDYLDKYYGAYIGQRLDSIALHKVEAILDVQSAILKSEAYTTEDGKVNVRLTQREPVIRFQKDGYGFYADCNGFIFPLQENYTTPVPVMDGAVPIRSAQGYKGAPETEAEREWMEKVIALVGYMGKSKIWAENIVQMHVDPNGDIVMIPREGKERFIFGSPTGVKGKFDRMSDYYRYILPEKGEGYYRTVNVKYDKQIVCKK